MPRKGSRRRAHWAMLLLATSMSIPKLGHAGFDALDPLGVMRKKVHTVSVEVAPGDWGNVDPRNVQLVLESVANEFLGSSVGLDKDLKLRVVPRSGAPRVLFDRGVRGEYQIQLTARDERWFQYAYQFAHELCHVASNFDHKLRVDDDETSANQWFEEALCETAALYTLKRLAVTWQSLPPTRNWIGYGETFAAYADKLAREPHRQLGRRSLSDWYSENSDSLRHNPYLREKNEIVAGQLLPLFEAHPEYWKAIAYLNPDTTSSAKPFAGYLADWYAASPDKALPAQVIARFGLETAIAASSDTTSVHATTASTPDQAAPHDKAVLGPDRD